MFGIETVEPWIGPAYGKADPKLLIVGDSRYDESYTDRMIIQDQVSGHRDPTFTRFVQAVLGKHHSEPGYDAEARAFWDRTAFYNYVTNFFAGTVAAPLDRSIRMDPQNGRVLREMLRAYKPTHAIVWGYANWESLVVEGLPWTKEGDIPGLDRPEPCRTAVVDGHATLFTRVLHPSSADFAYEDWAPMLSAFLALRSAA